MKLVLGLYVYMLHVYGIIMENGEQLRVRMRCEAKMIET